MSARRAGPGARAFGPRGGVRGPAFGAPGRVRAWGAGLRRAGVSLVRAFVCLSAGPSLAPLLHSFLYSLLLPPFNGSPPGAQHCNRRGETAESEIPVLLYSSRGGFFSLAPLGTSCPSSLPAVPCSVLITISGLHPPDASSLPRPRCDNQKCLQPFPSVPSFQNR